MNVQRKTTQTSTTWLKLNLNQPSKPESEPKHSSSTQETSHSMTLMASRRAVGGGASRHTNARRLFRQPTPSKQCNAAACESTLESDTCVRASLCNVCNYFVHCATWYTYTYSSGSAGPHARPPHMKDCGHGGQAAALPEPCPSRAGGGGHAATPPPPLPAAGDDNGGQAAALPPPPSSASSFVMPSSSMCSMAVRSWQVKHHDATTSYKHVGS